MVHQLRACLGLIAFTIAGDLDLPAASQQGNKPHNPLHIMARLGWKCSPSHLPPPRPDGRETPNMDRIGNECRDL